MFFHECKRGTNDLNDEQISEKSLRSTPKPKKEIALAGAGDAVRMALGWKGKKTENE